MKVAIIHNNILTGVFNILGMQNKEIYRPETLGTTQATAGLPPTSFAILALYPNPASDYLTCLLALPSAGVVEITLYDLSGRLVLEKRLEATEPTELEAILDVSGLASGVYTLRASSGGAEVSARAVLVR